MVKGKWFAQGSDITVPLGIRQAVFAREQDALDGIAQQVVVYDGETPVGAARLWWAEGAFHIGEVGVLEASRGQGFGDLLTRLLLFKALTHHATRVELSAPWNVAPFFMRYGFVTETATPEGVTHVPMWIRGEDIALSHCQNQCGGSCEDCPKR